MVRLRRSHVLLELDLSERVPYPILGALYHPPGGIIRHDAVVWAFARGADRLGVEIHPYTEVTGMERSDIEFSWSALNDSTAMGWFQEGNAADVQDRNEVFRCNLRVTHNETQANNGSLTFEDNIIQHSGTYTNGVRATGSLVPTVTDNTTGTSGLLNSTTGLAVSIDNEHGCEFTV